MGSDVFIHNGLDPGGKYLPCAAMPDTNMVQQHIRHILYLHGLPLGLDTLVWAMLRRVWEPDEKDGLVIYLNARLRELLAEECSFSGIQTLNNAISKLSKGGILNRVASGTYQFNPALFGARRWQDIEHISTEVVSGPDGQKFRVNITYSVSA